MERQSNGCLNVVSFHRTTKVAIVCKCPIAQSTLRQWIDSSDHFRCVNASGSVKHTLSEICKSSADVLLMDTHLGRESGISYVSALKEQCPRMHVIMLSDFQDHETVFQALRAGASGYLLKGAGREEILWAISEVLSGGAPMTRQIARRVVEGLQRPSLGSMAAAKLSRREQEVLTLLSKGKSTKQIAADLGISYQTACVHLRRIYEKLKVRCRTEAVLWFLQSQGELAPPSSALWRMEVSV